VRTEDHGEDLPGLPSSNYILTEGGSSMKIIEVEAYTYQELKPHAKKEAWYGFYEPILQENVEYFMKMEVENFRDFLENKLKATSVEINYSCGKSQGDGAAFSCNFGIWTPEKHKELSEVSELSEVMQSKEAQAFLDCLNDDPDLTVDVSMEKNSWSTHYAHENTVSISYTIDGNYEDVNTEHVIQAFLETVLQRRLKELMQEFHIRLCEIYDEGCKSVPERLELIEQGYFDEIAWFTKDGTLLDVTY
jgi:hypothetical protein